MQRSVKLTQVLKNSVNISGRGIIIRNPDFPNDVLIAQSGVLALSRDNGKTWKNSNQTYWYRSRTINGTNCCRSKPRDGQ